jgi:O6-methylguanine-DNA--protein-cysteine methyltransferase
MPRRKTAPKVASTIEVSAVRLCPRPEAAGMRPEPIGFGGAMTEEQSTVLAATPLGLLEAVSAAGVLRSVRFVRSGSGRSERKNRDPLLASFLRQLDRYFGGAREPFDLPIAGGLTDRFRETVREVPFGSLLSVDELASRAGAAEAVASAARSMDENPLLFVIPSHRVVGRLRRGGPTSAASAAIETLLRDHEASWNRPEVVSELHRGENF